MSIPGRLRVALEVAGIVLLGASLAGNWSLYQLARGYYTELQATRLDPLGLNAFPIEPPPDTAGRLVVFAGDSRAAEWPAPEGTSLVFVNRGVGGQTTAQIAGRYPDQVLVAQPDVVLLQAGINDLKTVPLFPDRVDQIQADTLANLRQMIRQTQASGAHVIVTTIFLPGEISLRRQLVWSGDVLPAIQSLNAALRAEARESVVVLDSAALLSSDGARTDPAYSRDSLHLTDAGYARLNEALTPLLLSLEDTD